MNQSKKLGLSKETLRCLDDQDLTDVVGGWGGEKNSDVCSGVCFSNFGEQNNSCVCIQSGVCIG